MYLEDTICAIATPIGTGGISVIRVSGSDAINKVNQIFKGKNLEKVKSHTVHFGKIVNAHNREEVIDEVLVTVFHNEKSFTGESVCEISTHGGVLITELVLKNIMELGVRLAEPGEFTKRAFLNRKIDLIQAEGVMDIISAESNKAAKVAIKALSGETTNMIDDFSLKILNVVAEIEVNIDYPEYDASEEMTKASVYQKVQELVTQLSDIILKSKKTTLIKQGIKTAIIGRTNVGKSSLLNALLGEEKAIVTNIAGTTRDLVDGYIEIEGIAFHLVDTAGIRKSEDVVEQIGIERAIKLVLDAELLLLVIDQSVELSKEDLELIELTNNKPRIIILNKSDLPSKIEIPIEGAIPLSALQKKGITKLNKAILKLFKLDEITDNDYSYLSNIRHLKILEETLEILKQAKDDEKLLLPIDFLSIELNKAYLKIGEITGRNSYDEFLNTLFSNFCLGK